MKKMMLAVFMAITLTTALHARERQLFDHNWLFMLADSTQMSQPGYHDGAWRGLTTEPDRDRAEACRAEHGDAGRAESSAAQEREAQEWRRATDVPSRDPDPRRGRSSQNSIQHPDVGYQEW